MVQLKHMNSFTLFFYFLSSIFILQHKFLFPTKYRRPPRPFQFGHHVVKPVSSSGLVLVITKCCHSSPVWFKIRLTIYLKKKKMKTPLWGAFSWESVRWQSKRRRYIWPYLLLHRTRHGPETTALSLPSWNLGRNVWQCICCYLKLKKADIFDFIYFHRAKFVFCAYEKHIDLISASFPAMCKSKCATSPLFASCSHKAKKNNK